MDGQVNAGGSARLQGRDHSIKISAGNRQLTSANVHLELRSNLRDLRGGRHYDS